MYVARHIFEKRGAPSQSRCKSLRESPKEFNEGTARKSLREKDGHPSHDDGSEPAIAGD
jgi:hypothetical protein